MCALGSIRLSGTLQGTFYQLAAQLDEAMVAYEKCCAACEREGKPIPADTLIKMAWVYMDRENNEQVSTPPPPSSCVVCIAPSFPGGVPEYLSPLPSVGFQHSSKAFGSIFFTGFSTDVVCSVVVGLLGVEWAVSRRKRSFT